MSDEIERQVKVNKIKAFLDDLIDNDPDAAERFIESWLARLALRKRLKAKQAAEAAQAWSGDPSTQDYASTLPEAAQPATPLNLPTQAQIMRLADEYAGAMLNKSGTKKARTALQSAITPLPKE